MIIKIMTAALSLLVGICLQDGTQQNIRVTYVVTDLVVRDAAGNFISGLKPEDLALTIDGRAVNIRSLDEFALITRESQQIRQYLEEVQIARETGETPPPPPSQPRLFIFVIDTASLGQDAFAGAVETLERMIKTVILPYDSVTILEYRDSFNVIAAPTTNAVRALSQLEAWRAPGGMGTSMIATSDIGLNPLVGDESAATEAGRMRASLAARRYVESMEGLARTVSSFPGKKSMVLFSDGPNIINLQRFFSFGSNRMTRPQTMTPGNPEMAAVREAAEFNQHLKTMARALNSAGISVYSVRRGAMEPEWVQLTATALQAGEGIPDKTAIYSIVKNMEIERIGTMQVMAENTHGRFYDAALPTEQLIEDIQERTGTYYLLGFSAPADTEGRFHSLRVTAKNPALRITHREGFFGSKSPASMSESERAVHLEEGFYMTPQPDELGIEVQVRVLPTTSVQPLALISVSADPRRLGRGELRPRDLECVVNIEADGKEIIFRRHWIRTAPGEKAPGGHKWFTLLAPINADRPSTVHVALRDGGSFNRSARSVVIEPPAQSGTAVRSTTLLCSPEMAGDLSSWAVEKAKDEKGGGDIPIPFHARVLPAGELPPGKEVIALVLIGGLTVDMLIPEATPEAMALFEPNSAEQVELPATNPEWKYDAEHRLLWIKTRVDLNDLPKASGRLGIVIQGLLANRPLATMTSFDFGY